MAEGAAYGQASGSRRRGNVIDPSKGIREQVSQTRLILILVGIMLGMLLSAVDQTVVGTAMPRIIADLHGLNEYAWVTTSYMLASTVMVPIYGKLSDVYGRRPFFLLGMAVFLAGSALSGTAHSMDQLIIYRGIQGLGGGAMMPIVQAIIGDIFPPAERGKWQGMMMAVFGLATIIGPWAGGQITDTWGWRWVFYVNMPIGVLALITCGIALPSIYRKAIHAIDYWGSTLLVVAAVPLLLAFSWAGNQYPWGDWRVLSLFAFSAVMWVAFIIREQRAAEPIIEPKLFGDRIFTVSVGATFLVAMGMFGAIMYIPLFVQAVIGDSAAGSGVVLTPMMLGFMASNIIGGQMMSRSGKYKTLAIVAMAVAVFGMFLLSQIDASATNGLMVRDMIILGLGLGVMMSLFTIVVQNAFSFKMMGSVTATLQFFRSIGGTIGIAVLGSLLTSRFQSGLTRHLPPHLLTLLPAGKLAGLANPAALLSPAASAQLQHAFASLGPQGQLLARQLIDAVKVSLALATDELFRVGAILLVVAFVVTLFLKEIPLRKSFDLDQGKAQASPLVKGVIGVALADYALRQRPLPVGSNLVLEPARLRQLSEALLRAYLTQHRSEPATPAPRAPGDPVEV